MKIYSNIQSKYLENMVNFILHWDPLVVFLVWNKACNTHENNKNIETNGRVLILEFYSLSVFLYTHFNSLHAG